MALATARAFLAVLAGQPPFRAAALAPQSLAVRPPAALSALVGGNGADGGIGGSGGSVNLISNGGANDAIGGATSGTLNLTQQQQKKPRRIKPGQGCLASVVSVGVATHASILTTPKSMPRVAGALNDYDYSRAICRGRALGDLSLMRS